VLIQARLTTPSAVERSPASGRRTLRCGVRGLEAIVGAVPMGDRSRAGRDPGGWPLAADSAGAQWADVVADLFQCCGECCELACVEVLKEVFLDAAEK
jgi:hypothetical protein